MDGNSVFRKFINTDAALPSKTIVKQLVSSDAQQQVLNLLSKDVIATLAFNEVIALDLRGEVDVGLLDNAIQSLVEANEFLRSTFSADGKFIYVKESVNSVLKILNLSESINAETQLAVLQKAEVQNPFDLENESGFRTTLIILNKQKSILLLSAHRLFCERPDLYKIAELLLSHDYNLSEEKKTNFNLNKNYKIENKTFHLPVSIPEDQFANSETAVNAMTSLSSARPSSEFQSYHSKRVDKILSAGALEQVRQHCGYYNIDLNAFMLSSFICFQTKSLSEKLIEESLFDQCLEKMSVFRENLDRYDSFTIQNQKIGFSLEKTDLSFTLIPRSFDLYEFSIQIIFSNNNAKIYCQYNAGLFESEAVETYLNLYLQFLDSLTAATLFWKNTLLEPMPILNLPFEHSNPESSVTKNEVFSFAVRPHQLKSLSNFCVSNQLTIPSVLLAVFKIVLQRYSEAGAIDVTSLIVNVNQLPVRTEFLSKKSFLDNIKHISSVFELANSYGFDSLRRFLGDKNFRLQNNFNYSELPTPIDFHLNNSNDQNINVHETKLINANSHNFQFSNLEQADSGLQTSNYKNLNTHQLSSGDLDLAIKFTGGNLSGQIQYRSDLLSKEVIQGFHEIFEHTLSQLDRISHLQLSEIDFVPRAQKNRLLKYGKGPLDANILPRPIHSLIADVALQHTDDVAIQSNDQNITYGQLMSKVQSLSLSLRENGIGRGDLVGLSVSRNADLIVAILAIFQSGAGYVPLDPIFPQDRLDYIINQSKLRYILTEESSVNLFSSQLNLLDINELFKQHINEENENASQHIKDFSRLKIQDKHCLQDTAYVMYTSGSTGQPKGVEITHQAVSNFLQSMREEKICSSEDRVLAITTISFDISILELFLPLLCGGSVFIAQHKDVSDGEKLRVLLEQQQISLLQATPSTWRMLLSAGWNGSQHFKNFGKALCGGEAFPMDLVLRLQAISHSVWNMYGPTETTVWSSFKRLEADDKQVTLGQPIANTEFYVLDDHLKLRPMGAAGQLFISGQGLARGYYNRRDLTVEKFLANPFKPNERMYATGDVVRYNAKGELLFLGRTDSQVKIRGYRIELGEIQHLLQQINCVQEVAVVTQEVQAGDCRIIAYVVLNLNESRTVDERYLRYMLSQKLPAYMIPAHFVFISKIAKNLSGKIDKKQLPPMVLIEHNTEFMKAPSFFLESNDSIKESIRKLWQEVLLKDTVSDQDNFFDIGGNSLIAVDLYARIQSKYKIEMPLSLLIESKNFQAFVSTVESRLGLQHKAFEFHLQSNQVQRFQSMVAISLDGDRNPLFCFHAVGGNILNYVGLLSVAKKARRPLLALQSIGLANNSASPVTIEEMAKAYVLEMKRTQPTGPYLLAGGSMGGLIAYEVAQQLIAAGDQVEQIIMFDTVNPVYRRKVVSTAKKNNLWSRAQYSFRNRVKNYIHNLKVNFKATLCRAFDLPVPLSLLLYSVERNNYKAIARYEPRAIKGNICLLRAPVSADSYRQDPSLGWKDLIQGEMKIFEINAEHKQFIECPELLNVLSTLI